MKTRWELLRDALVSTGIIARTDSGGAWPALMQARYDQAAAEYDKATRTALPADVEAFLVTVASPGRMYQRGSASDIPRLIAIIREYQRNHAFTMSEWERDAKRANAAEAERDELRGRVAELNHECGLCRSVHNERSILVHVEGNTYRCFRCLAREQSERLAKLEGPPAPGTSQIRLLVLHKRDDAEWKVYPFDTFTEARIAYDQFAASWTGTFLVRIVMGPPDEVQAEAPPMPRIFDELIAERNALRKRVEGHERWLESLRDTWGIPDGTTIHEHMKAMERAVRTDAEILAAGHAVEKELRERITTLETTLRAIRETGHDPQLDVGDVAEGDPRPAWHEWAKSVGVEGTGVEPLNPDDTAP